MFFKIIRGLAWATFTFGGLVFLFAHGPVSTKGLLVTALSTVILLTAHPSRGDY